MMASLYLAAYITTLLPWQLNAVMNFQQPFSNISHVLYRFNGLGNVLAYALNANLARATVLSPEVLGDGEPADNEFVQWAGASNVRVGFELWAPEEHSVAWVQRVALRRSENEIRDLEAASAVEDYSDA